MACLAVSSLHCVTCGARVPCPPRPSRVVREPCVACGVHCSAACVGHMTMVHGATQLCACVQYTLPYCSFGYNETLTNTGFSWYWYNRSTAHAAGVAMQPFSMPFSNYSNSWRSGTLITHSLDQRNILHSTQKILRVTATRHLLWSITGPYSSHVQISGPATARFSLP